VVTRIITEGLFTIPPHDDSIQKMRVQLELRGTGTLIKMEPVVFSNCLVWFEQSRHKQSPQERP